MKKQIKWLFSLALVLTAFFAFAIPVLAAGNVTLTGNVTLSLGETSTVTTSAGYKYSNYECEWYDDGGMVFCYNENHDRAIISALNPGTGMLSCAIYVYEDDGSLTYTETEYWTVTVNGGSYYTDDLIVLAYPNQSILEVGESVTCSAETSGGAGGYSYYWSSSNDRVVSLSSSSRSSVTAVAQREGSATIEVRVEDRNGNVDYDSIYVTVNAPARPSSTMFSTSASTRVGSTMSFNAVAREIADYFYRDLGEKLDYGATVQFGTVNNSIGSIRFGNTGETISTRNTYSYATFQDMSFDPYAAGTFSTTYTINQGYKTIGGTITVTVTGGVGVSSVTASPANMELAPYSTQFIQLNVSPSNANYTVSWSTSDANVATVNGRGATGTVSTYRSGTATITATVTDANGAVKRATATVSVASAVTYDPSLAISLGSDYQGTDTSASMRRQYLDSFGRELDAASARIEFSSLGSSAVGTMKLNGSAIVPNRSYTFNEWVSMTFTAAGAGTYTLPYTLTCGNNTLKGTVRLNVAAARVSAALSDTEMTLASYSNQFLNLDVTPRTERYNVTWTSTNPNVASASGSGDSVRVEAKGIEGTTEIYASVSDVNGVILTKRCTVTVKRSSTYNPTVSTVLGSRYTGTGTSEAMAKEFGSVFGTALNPGTATIRFTSTGNGIAVLRLADGTPVNVNTDYTFQQYISMYTDPIAAGTFTIPYALTDNGKSLTGNVNVDIKPSSIEATLLLSGSAPYQFNQAAANGLTGASELRSVITNVIGSGWSAVRFSGYSFGNAGALYAGTDQSAVSAQDISGEGLDSLYFIPAQSGTYSIPFTVQNAADGALADGVLHIKVNVTAAELFGDVKPGDWYYDAVVWAAGKGIARGTGTDNATGKDLFSPNETCSTGHILTFLWRAQGSPASSIQNPFNDLSSSDDAYGAALWAYEKGLVSGTSFRGASPCTRAEAVTYMWKLAGRPTAANAGFSDLSAGTDAALAANWAYANGIAVGTGTVSGSPVFSPNLSCTRGTIVTLLYRAYK